MKTEDELIAAGFTESGRARYRATADDYCVEVFEKAVALGDRDKAQGLPRGEVDLTAFNQSMDAAAQHFKYRFNRGPDVKITDEVGRLRIQILRDLVQPKADASSTSSIEPAEHT